MNRRDFIKSAGAASGAVAADAGSPEDASKQPRQVIVILGESVRRDMLNCYRQTGLHTPNLDRLAAQGARFDRAYNCQPVCAPARSALWTGLYPHTNGVWGNSMALGDTVHTIGQRLHDRGIECGFIGKWHLSGTDYFDTGIPAPGWNETYWYDMRRYLGELSIEDRRRSRDPLTGNDDSWTADLCYGHRVTNRAVDYLSTHKDRDFLLVVAYDEPHGPSLCPAEYSRQYENFVFPRDANAHDPLTHKPASQKIWADSVQHSKESAQGAKRNQPKHFFGSHTFIDAQIGLVLDQIEKSAPNALVIYTSDHGVFLGSHRLSDKGPAMYEEITNIPFIARWPGTIEPHTVSQALVSHVDMAGTLMEFFGFEIPKTLEGSSLLPVLRNPSLHSRKEVLIEWGRYEVDHDGFGGYQPIRCICDGRYKLAINLMATDELYDLQSDPGEMRNLIGSHELAPLRRQLHDRLLTWMNDSRDPFRGYYWGRRSWRNDFPEMWTNSGMTRQRESDGYLPRELDYDTGLTMTAATRPKS